MLSMPIELMFLTALARRALYSERLEPRTRHQTSQMLSARATYTPSVYVPITVKWCSPEAVLVLKVSPIPYCFSSTVQPPGSASHVHRLSTKTRSGLDLCKSATLLVREPSHNVGKTAGLASAQSSSYWRSVATNVGKLGQ